MLGDFRAGDVIDCFFNTAYGGTPTTLAGSPAISVYKDNSLTQSTAGVTLDVDFDGLTGLHHVRITTASDGTFYSDGSDFGIVVTTGTVGGVSVVGTEVERFSLANRSNLTAAEVNAEVVDALNVDTYAEPGQGAPAATATIAGKIGLLHKLARNKVEQTATTLKVYDDAGTTVDQKAVVSDDGSVFTRNELGSGP